MYTKAQLSAINAPSKDILVSAGAGSGKTTVLTQRIMEKIAEGNCSLKDFLIVTFTKASAADLRKKLGKRLEELSTEFPERTRYRKMLYALPKADIGTIDGFCLQHVKQNAAALGLYKGVAVGDEALCDALLTDAADNLITELCEEDDERIDLLLDNFASFKNDNGLISTLRTLYTSLRKYPFYNDWLDEVLATHQKEAKTVEEKGFFAGTNGKSVQRTLGKHLSFARKCLNDMHAFTVTDVEAAFAEEAEAAFGPLEEGFKVGYAEYCTAAAGYSIRKRPSSTGKEFTAAYNLFKGVMDGRKTYVRNQEELREEYDRTGKVLAALSFVMKRLDEDYAAAKAERGIIDFPDAEQLFFKLLLEKTPEGTVKTPLCRSISARYKEVFIDEYQDVSPLQDAIFTAIGAGKRFMVGDLKQSIYGFRDAYPDIFMGYRDTFDPVEKDGDSAVIYLRENFRCDEGIINFCNYLFLKTFTKERADTDYSTEQLKKGKKSEASRPVCITLLEEADEEREAEHVAEQIVGLIYEGYLPKQIAVIAREVKSIETVSAALEKRGVPSAAAKTTEDLLKQPEILLATSLIKVIDNPNDDVALAALLRSPIFRFTAEELVLIRAFGGRGVSFYACLTAAAKDEGSLGTKCRGFLEKLTEYRAVALVTPADAFIWYLYEDTHLLALAPEGREYRYRDNLIAFYEMARSMENDTYKGISAFVEYIGRLNEDDRSPKVASASAEDAVSLMTIHGSKGLEFPVVFVMGTGAKINKPVKESLSVNYRKGVSVKLTKQKEGWRTSTVLRNAAIEEQKSKNIAEEYRLLYVAFTRAEERLYISAPLEKTEEIYMEKQGVDPSLQMDLFLPYLIGFKDESFVFQRIKAEDEVPCTVLAAAMARGMAEPPLPAIRETPLPPKRITAKYAVSTVKKMPDGTLGTDTASLVTGKVPLFAGGGIKEGALRGTATHAFMQFADYALAEKDAAAEADRLVSRGFISAEDRKRLDLDAIRGFFASDLYGEIKGARRVYREKRFTTELPAALFGAEGEEVLVQGVIDCFFENSDGTFTLVDYKTDALRAGEEESLCQRYGVQLYLYSLYIERITGKRVKEAYLYSLSLGKAIPCQTEKYGV
ncbi:MAG: UvrD-helicase domain-containing protein [Clostridia bacterium]|nr:UvrD-helicase domain-containing protein [Clostridia bacterium]